MLNLKNIIEVILLIQRLNLIDNAYQSDMYIMYNIKKIVLFVYAVHVYVNVYKYYMLHFDVHSLQCVMLKYIHSGGKQL